MTNDLISREALKAKIQEIVEKEMPIDEKWAIGLRYSLKVIDNAHAVEVIPLEHHNKIKNIMDNEIKSLVDILDNERPQGEWGKNGECPFCSYIRQWEDDKFCGNCGAKMQKGGAE